MFRQDVGVSQTFALPSQSHKHTSRDKMSSDAPVQRADFFSCNGSTREGFLRIIAHVKAKIDYSERYRDDKWEYRHVRLPRQYESMLPSRLITEEECRMLGITQSPGWEHYMIHRPEPWVLLFRRPLEGVATTTTS